MEILLKSEIISGNLKRSCSRDFYEILDIRIRELKNLESKDRKIRKLEMIPKRQNIEPALR